MSQYSLTKSYSKKQPSSIFDQFSNKQYIKSRQWKWITSEDKFNLQNRFLIFFFYQNDIYKFIHEKERQLKDQKKTFSKHEFNKKVSQISRLKNKLSVQAEIYFELWNPNFVFSLQFFPMNEQFNNYVNCNKKQIYS